MRRVNVVGRIVLVAGGVAGATGAAMAQSPWREPVLRETLERVYPNGVPANLLGLEAPRRGAWNDTGDPGAPPKLVTSGPDVIVGSLCNSLLGDQTETIAPVSTVGSFRAYGIGTTSCNIGDTRLLWDDSSARKPVIAQNLYRLKNGRIEQIGQSWLKHGFFALSDNLCATCDGSGGWVLGVGCADTYSSSLNRGSSNANGLGPRYEVNPFTGRYNWPIQTTTAVAPVSDGTYRRLRVNTADLADGGTAGVYYFGEGEYITPDDAAFGNGGNNASYRRLTVNPSTGVLTFTTGTGNATARGKPAIFAWQDFGGPGGTPNPSVIISTLTAGASFSPGAWQLVNNVAPGGAFYLPNVPTGDGILYLGSLASDNGDGTWHYEYALFNLSSDRMGGSLIVPVPAGATVTNAQWRGIDAHSGVASEDATRNAPWTTTVSGSSVLWAAPVAYDPGQPTLGNGVRWGTMYNFRFDSNVPPVNTGSVTMGFYKPGVPDSVTGTAWTPDPSWTPPVCYANCDGSTDVPSLSAADFACFLSKFRAGDPYANCDGSTDVPTLSAADFACYLSAFRAGCP